MSGGIAYVYDPTSSFSKHCNTDMVELERVEQRGDADALKTLIDKHAIYTGSSVANALLDDWVQSIRTFVKVMPTDYKRVLAEREIAAEIAETESH
jgi:glutamate synthase domain-containing protein 3